MHLTEDLGSILCQARKVFAEIDLIEGLGF